MTQQRQIGRRQLIRAAATGVVAAAAIGVLSMNAAHAQTGDVDSPAKAPTGTDADAAAAPAKHPAADAAPVSAASAAGQSAPATAEGVALADAAGAAAGHALPRDAEVEVRKQLASYPGAFEKARKFKLGNADAPYFGVTRPISRN